MKSQETEIEKEKELEQKVQEYWTCRAHDFSTVRKNELKDNEIVFSQYENDKEKILKNTDEISQLQKTLKMYLTENDSLKNIENDYSAKYIEWKNARKTFEQISDRYVTAQAAILAAKLENGKPCPVCGAKVQVRKTKRKKKYYICEHNPETCNYISWNKPKIGEKWEPEKEKEVTKPKRKTRKKK